MPKILHIPLNVAGSEQVGQEKGFRAVFSDYRQFDFLTYEGQNGRNATNEALIALVREFEPDIIWAQLQMTDVIMPQTWEAIRQIKPDIWLTCWSGDARSEVSIPQQQYLPYFDIFYNCTDQEMYKSYARRVEFMPIAIDPDEASDWELPRDMPPPRDIVFLGNNYPNVFSNSQFRYDLMVALSKEFGSQFGVYGTGWDSNVENMGSVPLKSQGAYYHAAKVVVSVDHIQGILHHSERLPWALASGSAVVVQIQSGIDKWFKTNDHCLYFNTIPECVDAIYTQISASDMAKATNSLPLWHGARDFILKEHSWTNRAEQVKMDYENRGNK